MTLSFIFFLILLLWFLSWVAGRFGGAAFAWAVGLSEPIAWILFLILGVAQWGWPIKG